jgi:hypothetical protein
MDTLQTLGLFLQHVDSTWVWRYNTYLTTKERTMSVNISQITRVYNGKTGCLCGCGGKYSTNPAFRELVGKERGYDVWDEECNERSVKIIAKKVLTHPNAVQDGDCVYVEDRVANKMQIVWFAKQ